MISYRFPNPKVYLSKMVCKEIYFDSIFVGIFFFTFTARHKSIKQIWNKILTQFIL
ncbi:hypothetical protein LEP1GSC202_1784 [Leptospira yanagawae serovar Saopaulo str. Sao Paulo = ATCC 700523]|uniref:Uncharacterized protein n=1 Tax=Leptospira yanagawae serovar Saopaulo str. Sao Paulo = ATCC 700523 TaxID=1249483 RepID=A0A5E8HCR8_9LEPT|nr:hypothetical protein LEP1GSC202_1784 [Leptospira yanagawae serovar Saopaulo str. Sao Paulo = ATCC 700523]